MTILAAIGQSLHEHPLPWALGYLGCVIAAFRLDEDLLAGIRMLVALCKQEPTP